ncbi:DUF423 domain-containing protein [bacterium]|nr:DUF423 domain-containing protein [bacterium]
MKSQLKISALLLALAVGAGAFGAHALRGMVIADRLAVYEKAVFYQFIHSLGLLFIPLLVKNEFIDLQSGERIYLLLLLGVLIFSGSLYILVLTNTPWLGAITPIGGILLITAWISLGFALK